MPKSKDGVYDTKAVGNKTDSGQPDQKKNKGLKQLSHALSWVLRHKAIELGLTMTRDGFVPVREILNLQHAKFRGYDLDEVRAVVETNDKQRFKLEERPASDYGLSPLSEKNAVVLCIRANQGHSIPIVDPNFLLEKLSSAELAAMPVIVHGTYKAAWGSIRNQGLSRMNRNHIHFATGLPTEDKVISGMRKSCDIYIYIDAKKCAEHGIDFFRSENAVLLTAGKDDEGVLSTEYFTKVTTSKGERLL
jgi:2'-phosphotransferase